MVKHVEIEQGSLTPEQWKAVLRALVTDTVQDAMGAGDWSLTEEEENELWTVIHRIEGRI